MSVATLVLQCSSACGSLGSVFEDEDKRGWPRDEQDGRKRISPSAERNKEPIRKVIEKHLTRRAKILEVGSGTGQHVSYFASHMSAMSFQPSEWSGYASPRHEEHSVYDSLQSIDAYCEQLPNVKQSVPLDIAAESWEEIEDLRPKPRYDCLLAINVLHITSPAVKDGLFKGACRILNKSRGIIIIYGPFSIAGDILSEGNAHFDHTLRSTGQDGWGIIDTKEVDAYATAYGFESIAVERMPSNNLCLVYAKCAK